MREVPLLAADLPDAAIGALPVLLQEVQQRALERPGGFSLLQPRGARTVQRDHDLAEDVPLALFVRGVAHPNRGGAAIAGQLKDVVLVQATLSADAVHDLRIARSPRDGPQQPPAPLLRLRPIPVSQQHADRESSIPQPHIPVIPVPAAALGLRQAGGRRRRNAPGVLIGQRSQDEQRPLHLLVVRARRFAAGGPIAPPVDRHLESSVHIERRGRITMRRIPGDDEIHHVALTDREVRRVPEVLGLHLRATPDHGRRPGRREEGGLITVRRLTHPGNGRPVIEADGDLLLERHASANATDPSDDVRSLVAERHEVPNLRLALRGLPSRLENERVRQVRPADVDNAAGRRERPPTRVVAVEEGSEEGRRVETRQTEPVNGTDR